MRWKKILITVLLLSGLAMLVAYNALYVNPQQLTIREEKIQDNKLSASFNDTLIVYFSDLHYGQIDDAYLNETVSEIMRLSPDLILFGGDLVDHYSRNPLNDEKRQVLITALASLKAPLGKFAVLGNHDLDSDNTKNAIINILEAADFTILDNQAVKIYNQNGDAFNLVGIDSLALGHPDIDKAFDDVGDELYNLVLCHTPDIFDDLPLSVDYLLAGHSHGGQVYIPFISSFYVPYGCQKYYHGKYDNGNTILDITNGVGTTKEKIRLNADSEIVAYRLHS